MKELTILSITILLLLSGCTQIVTAPISVASSLASATVDVAGSTIGAVTPGD